MVLSKMSALTCLEFYMPPPMCYDLLKYGKFKLSTKYVFRNNIIVLQVQRKGYMLEYSSVSERGPSS